MRSNGLWGAPGKAPDEPFDFKRFFSHLVADKGLRPGEVADLTLNEALLYTQPAAKGSATLKGAWHKAKAILALPVDHYLELARIRTRR